LFKLYNAFSFYSLAVALSDEDYTRIRQLFLRDMCQKLLAGDRAASFSFCIGIVALHDSATPV
jgi:hypothetical protein